MHTVMWGAKRVSGGRERGVKGLPPNFSATWRCRQTRCGRWSRRSGLRTANQIVSRRRKRDLLDLLQLPSRSLPRSLSPNLLRNTLIRRVRGPLRDVLRENTCQTFGAAGVTSWATRWPSVPMCCLTKGRHRTQSRCLTQLQCRGRSRIIPFHSTLRLKFPVSTSVSNCQAWG